MTRIRDGIVLYNIEMDGCLNGVYTNESSMIRGKIFNEVARKRERINTEVIIGIYECFFFDNLNLRVNAILKIVSEKSDRVYKFTWRDEEGNFMFEGIGYKMNEAQIAVHYWD
jgi:hypothetical protein